MANSGFHIRREEPVVICTCENMFGSLMVTLPRLVGVKGVRMDAEDSRREERKQNK